MFFIKFYNHFLEIDSMKFYSQEISWMVFTYSFMAMSTLDHPDQSMRIQNIYLPRRKNWSLKTDHHKNINPISLQQSLSEPVQLSPSWLQESSVNSFAETIWRAAMAMKMIERMVLRGIGVMDDGATEVLVRVNCISLIFNVSSFYILQQKMFVQSESLSFTESETWNQGWFVLSGWAAQASTDTNLWNLSFTNLELM